MKNDSKSEKEKSTESEKEEDSSDKITTHKDEAQPVKRRGSPAWMILLGLVVIYFAGVILGVIPANFLSQMFHTLTEWTRGIGL